MRAALAVTEDAGNTPRAMATTVRDDGAHLVVEGAKSFVTLGTHADELLVLAREGEDDAGRARLALVRIPRDARGVTLTAFPPPPFVPEVPHARATFSAVHVPHDARLEGDGWSDYVKPFRTVEDAHVHAALLGYVVAVARRAAWPRDVLTRLASFVAAAHTLCEADRDAPATHIALAGLLAETRALAVDDALWDRVDEATRAVWTRDRALLAVAEKARVARLERAFEALGPVSPRNS
jgi:alkylation response protein AidB-like acyl-CoA dehydrogenase